MNPFSLSKTPILLAAALAGAVLAPAAQAVTVLDHKSVSILSSAGAGGSGGSASDMVFPVFSADGWGWAGGAGGVQGSASITNTGGAATPANEVLRFNLGGIVDGLNTSYGAGNWTVDNLTLSFASSNARQNNSRFGVGSGSFDIYWVGNDNWAQSTGTVANKQLNPSYASTAASLLAWSGTQALLGSETFTRVGTTGYVSLSYTLANAASFVQDIVGASAASNASASLYLMGTSDTLGMIIFTGGQSQALPTLSFDVVSVSAPVPEPQAWVLLAGGLGLLAFLRRRAGRG